MARPAPLHPARSPPAGKVIYRKIGAIEPLEVKRAIVGLLGRTY